MVIIVLGISCVQRWAYFIEEKKIGYLNFTKDSTSIVMSPTPLEWRAFQKKKKEKKKRITLKVFVVIKFIL